MLFKSSLKFPNMFDLTIGDTNLDNTYTSINRCLALLLTSAKGELLGDPDYGCTLYERLFNNYTITQKDIIISEIIEAINKYEKRITVNNTDINIESDPNNDHRYMIHIKYSLKNSDIPSETYVTITKKE